MSLTAKLKFTNAQSTNGGTCEERKGRGFSPRPLLHNGLNCDFTSPIFFPNRPNLVAGQVGQVLAGQIAANRIHDPISDRDLSPIPDRSRDPKFGATCSIARV
jgi:hypothetical protein